MITKTACVWVVAASTWFDAARTEACDCGPVPTVSQALATSHAVFVGLLRDARSPNTSYPRPIVLQVERTWKGVQLGEEVTMWQFGHDCDSLGARQQNPTSRRYLVFAQLAREGADRGRLFGDHCTNPVFNYRLSWEAVLDTVEQAAITVFRAGCDVVTTNDVDTRARETGGSRVQATEDLVNELLIRREAQRLGIAAPSESMIDDAVALAAGRSASVVYAAIEAGDTGMPSNGVGLYRRSVGLAIMKRQVGVALFGSTQSGATPDAVEAAVEARIDQWLIDERVRTQLIQTRTRNGRCRELPQDHAPARRMIRAPVRSKGMASQSAHSVVNCSHSRSSRSGVSW